jgi:hypothetical protein
MQMMVPIIDGKRQGVLAERLLLVVMSSIPSQSISSDCEQRWIPVPLGSP